jgi:hypothetical protein
MSAIVLAPPAVTFAAKPHHSTPKHPTPNAQSPADPAPSWKPKEQRTRILDEREWGVLVKSPTSKESHVLAITLHEPVDKIDAETRCAHSSTRCDLFVLQAGSDLLEFIEVFQPFGDWEVSVVIFPFVLLREVGLRLPLIHISQATLALSAHVSDETSLCYLACFVLGPLLPLSTSAAVRPAARDELRLVALRVPAVAHRARRVTPQPVAVEGLFTSSCPVKVAGPVVASGLDDLKSVDTQRHILNTQHPTPIRRANSSEDRSPPQLPEGGKTHEVGSLAPRLGANA